MLGSELGLTLEVVSTVIPIQNLPAHLRLSLIWKMQVQGGAARELRSQAISTGSLRQGRGGIPRLREDPGKHSRGARYQRLGWNFFSSGYRVPRRGELVVRFPFTLFFFFHPRVEKCNSVVSQAVQQTENATLPHPCLYPPGPRLHNAAERPQELERRCLALRVSSGFPPFSILSPKNVKECCEIL